MDRQTTTEPVRITSLEAENVKRVKAVRMSPAPTGLTVIGGRNGQGKTSVLDAIAWALGGNRHRPSAPEREGSALPPALRVELSNGLVAERGGKNGDLKVIDPSGNRAGQALLDSFVGQLALDLPRFLAMPEREKAKTLLDAVGVGDELFDLQREERELYERRLATGRLRDRKQGAADDMPHYPDAPAGPVSATELILQQQEILARNGENQRKREQAGLIEAELALAREGAAQAEGALRDMQEALAGRRRQAAQLESDLGIARRTALDLADESTAEIEGSLAAIDEVNEKVRTNQARRSAQAEAEALAEEYRGLSERIEALRAAQTALLDGADLPLEGLGVADGEVTYRGRKWDGMASSEQLRVATSIAARLRPECGFVLLDGLEQMDPGTLGEFGRWAEAQGLQVIGTRVGTGDECAIVIEDGYGQEPQRAAWTKGEF